MALLSPVLTRLKQARTRRAFVRDYAAAAPSARAGRYPVVVVLDHPLPKGNAGCIVRSADVFGARAVHIIGTEYFDPASAMGALARAPVRFFRAFHDSHAELVTEGYTLFALEPSRDFAETALLGQVDLPEKTAFVLGNERHGLSFSPGAFTHTRCASIAHYGVDGSLNVAVAAGVALYEYARQHGRG